MKTNNGNKDSTGDNVSVQLLTSVDQILHAYAEVPTLAATDVTNNDDVSDILKESDALSILGTIFAVWNKFWPQDLN